MLRCRKMSVCLYVRLSVKRRYSVETVKHIFIFSLSGSHAILVFPHPMFRQHSDGDPQTGHEKIASWTNVSLYLGNDTRQS